MLCRCRVSFRRMVLQCGVLRPFSDGLERALSQCQPELFDANWLRSIRLGERRGQPRPPLQYFLNFHKAPLPVSLSYWLATNTRLGSNSRPFPVRFFRFLAGRELSAEGWGTSGAPLLEKASVRLLVPWTAVAGCKGVTSSSPGRRAAFTVTSAAS